MLRLYLLGSFQMERDGQAVPTSVWARPRDRALLKLLALQRGHVIPQDRLLDQLWPQLDGAAAANSLHVALSRLRRVLDPDRGALAAESLVRRSGSGYLLAADARIWVDAEEFRRLVAQGRQWQRRAAWAPAIGAYRAAEALWRGEPLEEDGAALWAVGPRAALRESRLTALADLADCLLRQGAAAEALAVAEQGLALDQPREAFHALAMRAHAAMGHVAEALRAYDRCRRALADELGADPGPALQALYERLLRDETLGDLAAWLAPHPARADAVAQGSASAARSGSGSRQGSVWLPGADGSQLPLVGRDAPLARLDGAYTAAENGAGSIIFVHGEPGIGKTRLLDAFAARVAARGARVLSARCYALERDLPYAPLTEALTTFLLQRADPAEVAAAVGRWGPQLVGIVPTLADLLPDLPARRPMRADAAQPGTLTAGVLAGLAHLVDALGARAPVLLMLDDLQWADPSTIHCLHYLGRRLGRMPLLIVGAYRTGEAEPGTPLGRLFDELARDPAPPPALALGCLEPAHVDALVASAVGTQRHAGELAARLFRRTDGHPLFLVETLRGWMAESGPTAATPDLPATLRSAILGRARQLDAPTQAALVALAVAGRGFTAPLLARLLDVPEVAALAALEALTTRQFLRAVAGGVAYDFRHDLVQETLYAEVPAARRRFLHGRAAESLEALTRERRGALDPLAGELAHHTQLAERWEDALRYALLAGDHARESFASREALAHYQRAAEVAVHCPPEVAAAAQADLLERLGQAHADLGDHDAAIERFSALRDLLRLSGDRPREARTLVALAEAYFWRHDLMTAQEQAAAALALAQTLDDPALIALARLPASNTAMARGQVDVAEENCAAILDLLDTLPAGAPGVAVAAPALAGVRLQVLGWLGLAHEFRADYARALPTIEASLRQGRELHNPFIVGRSRFALGLSLGNQGRYEEALAVFHEALRLAEEAGDRYWRPRLPNCIGWIYAELGDEEAAREWNLRSLPLARETGWLEAEANARVNLGADFVRAGQPVAAREHFEAATALLARDEWFRWRYRMRLLIGLGLLALYEGEPERALAFAGEALSLTALSGSRKHQARAHLLAGQALRSAGAPADQALAAYQQALDLARTIQHPALRWQTEYALADLHASLHYEEAAASHQAAAAAIIAATASAIRDPALRRSFLAQSAVPIPLPRG